MTQAPLAAEATNEAPDRGGWPLTSGGEGCTARWLLFDAGMETTHPQPSPTSTRLDAELVALRPRLVAHARRVAGSRIDPEDLVQVAYVKALERRERLAADADVRAWMSIVIRNIAIDEHRRHRFEPLDDADALAYPEPDPLARWKHHDIDEVKRALVTCAPPLRRAFELFYFQEMTLLEVAKALSVPVATVGVRLYRARRKIRAVVARLPGNAEEVS